MPQRYMMITFKRNNEILKVISFPLDELGDNTDARESWTAQLDITEKTTTLSNILLYPWGEA